MHELIEGLHLKHAGLQWLVISLHMYSVSPIDVCIEMVTSVYDCKQTISAKGCVEGCEKSRCFFQHHMPEPTSDIQDGE